MGTPKECPKAKAIGTISPFQTREASLFSMIPFGLSEEVRRLLHHTFQLRWHNSKSDPYSINFTLADIKDQVSL